MPIVPMIRKVAPESLATTPRTTAPAAPRTRPRQRRALEQGPRMRRGRCTHAITASENQNRVWPVARPKLLAESRRRRSNTSASSSGPPASKHRAAQVRVAAGDQVDQRQDRQPDHGGRDQRRAPAASCAARPAPPAPPPRRPLGTRSPRRRRRRSARPRRSPPPEPPAARKAIAAARGLGDLAAEALPRGRARRPMPTGISTARIDSSSLPIPKKRTPRPGFGPEQRARGEAGAGDHVDRVGADRDRAGDRERAQPGQQQRQRGERRRSQPDDQPLVHPVGWTAAPTSSIAGR